MAAGQLDERGNAALYNTIIAQNTSGTGQSAIRQRHRRFGRRKPGSSSADNLIGTGGSGGLVSGGFTDNMVGVANPGLATTLSSDGGLTQTLALLAGSPAIDAGSATIVGVTVPNVDQRGCPPWSSGPERGGHDRYRGF